MSWFPLYTSVLLAATLGLEGCNGRAGERGSGSVGLSAASASDSQGATSVGVSAGSTVGVATSGTQTSTTQGNASQGSGPVFDIGGPPDVGEVNVGPVIPETCQQADQGRSSVGCTFYAVDMDSSTDLLQFAVVAANVQQGLPANVSVQTRQGGVWTDIQGPISVPALGLQQFNLPDLHQENTGVRTAGSYRIVSDLPIVAYQFNPVDGAASLLSDASMLYPVPTWDSINHIINIRFNASSPGAGYPYLTIVAATDGTVVNFTPQNATTGGGLVPAAAAGQTVNFTLNDGDVATIVAANATQTLTGSRVVTDAMHPVGVFPGHSCANIPDNVCCCDHLEEQLSGVRQWGTNFVAAHMPYRGPQEATFWQVYASEDSTFIQFDAGPQVVGLLRSVTGPTRSRV